MDAYLKEKKNFLNSDVGRDIAKQIDLAGRPKVYLDNYKSLKSEYTIKETVFSISNEQQSRILELRNTLEGREIINQESISKIKKLQQEFEDSKILLEKKRESTSNEVKELQANATLKREELAAGNDSQEIKNKKLTEIEKKLATSMQKLVEKELKNYIEAEKTLKKERVYATIIEDPKLGEGLLNTELKKVPGALNVDSAKVALYDLLYSDDVRIKSSAAFALRDSGVKLGESTVLAKRQLVERIIPMNDVSLPKGAGHVRTFTLMGKTLIIPGIQGSNISSDLGIRNDPTTKLPSLHGALDEPMVTGTRIGTPVGGKVIYVSDESDKNVFNSAHKSGGLYVMIKISDELAIKVQHNSKILVKEGQEVKPGQAISLSGNSGRSTGPHTHVEFRKLVGKDDKGNYITEIFIPKTAEDIQKLEKAGLVK